MNKKLLSLGLIALFINMVAIPVCSATTFHGFYDYDHDKNQDGGEKDAAGASCVIARFEQDKWVYEKTLSLDNNGEVSWHFQLSKLYRVTISDGYGGYAWIWSKSVGWTVDNYNEAPLYNWAKGKNSVLILKNFPMLKFFLLKI